ncbi:Cysteine_synthase A [Hexamita inflata]|uniref:Cysteine_synthase A n=1 Tax=Hexamita inflata TaxID=28002 RepID=A0ABP1JA31_9EUKA
MIQDMLASNQISRETTIIEPTSVNTGIGLCLVAASLQLKVILTYKKRPRTQFSPLNSRTFQIRGPTFQNWSRTHSLIELVPNKTKILRQLCGNGRYRFWSGKGAQRGIPRCASGRD